MGNHSTAHSKIGGKAAGAYSMRRLGHMERHFSLKSVLALRYLEG